MNQVENNYPNCGLKSAIEPIFNSSSMYVSYGVGVVFAVAVYDILFFSGMANNPLTIITTIYIVLLLSFSHKGAVSKPIWTHLFFNSKHLLLNG